MDTRAGLQFMASKIKGGADEVQYRPQLVEVEPEHFVAEHDACDVSKGLTV